MESFYSGAIPTGLQYEGGLIDFRSDIHFNVGWIGNRSSVL